MIDLSKIHEVSYTGYKTPFTAFMSLRNLLLPKGLCVVDQLQNHPQFFIPPCIHAPCNMALQLLSLRGRHFPILDIGWSCDVLWLIECSRSEHVLVPRLGLKRSCALHFLSHNKLRLLYWMTKDTWPRDHPSVTPSNNQLISRYVNEAS